MRLIQLRTGDGARAVVTATDNGNGRRIGGVSTTYELVRIALDTGLSLQATVAARLSDERIDLVQAETEQRFLVPIDHPDVAHLHLSGTGLTHLGSAESRDEMHRGAAGQHETDSMRMFRLGVESGKPGKGSIGSQPEWFYKGNGSSVVGTGASLESPAFASDGSEEPELAGIYVIDDAGVPRRLGYCLANEFSDHVMERGNYLSLAHSKLRPAALGPELLSEIPHDVHGTSRILRDGKPIWEKAFLSGEANMSHSLVNLEHHHFKYALWRQPGDIHVHFFGTATLSFADGIRTKPGDVFEIEAAPFRFALRNTLGQAPESGTPVQAL